MLNQGCRCLTAWRRSTTTWDLLMIVLCITMERCGGKNSRLYSNQQVNFEFEAGVKYESNQENDNVEKGIDGFKRK